MYIRKVGVLKNSTRRWGPVYCSGSPAQFAAKIGAFRFRRDQFFLQVIQNQVPDGLLASGDPAGAEQAVEFQQVGMIADHSYNFV